MIRDMPGLEKEIEEVVQATKTIVGNTKSAQIGYHNIILMACSIAKRDINAAKQSYAQVI